MNNRKLYLLIIVISLMFTFLIYQVNRTYINSYNFNYNKMINGLVFKIKEKYPEISEREIMDIINENVDGESDLLISYGIRITDEAVSIKNQELMRQMFFVDTIIIFLLMLALLFIVFINNYRRTKIINKLIYYVEEINRKNYKLELLSNKEDNLSILQNEIYKTMVMLRESADNSLQDKISLKDSLSDISHQLKTPLTSISILLDNIIDDSDMSDEVRNDFIYDIKREITNINFLIHNILKISRFDTNTVIFNQDSINVSELLKEVKKNVEVLGDLNNITVNINCNKDIFFKGDYRWEIEALTNIVKNSIEYSKQDGEVQISVSDNKVYTKVVIKDYGFGIDKNDIRHIFERFYKVGDANNSFGIGLSLAKMIIESDNGMIKVTSKKNEGTTFEIKYTK